ncbi:hypothetical protein FOL47_005235 [Perkinsus chesapeaki]|uniref:Uncharacterized protein n=1 Tax=Perkinsus chesapeaki TaxID=330153 RepID=A0A7J6LY88_PERCH|nr:hypothetical protein FOL47_005235 [Perkinsus chesapeaki]
MPGRGVVLIPISSSADDFGESLASLGFLEKLRACESSSSRIDTRAYNCNPADSFASLESEIARLACSAGLDHFDVGALGSSDVTISALDSASEHLRNKLRERELFSQFLSAHHARA